MFLASPLGEFIIGEVLAVDAGSAAAALFSARRRRPERRRSAIKKIPRFTCLNLWHQMSIEAARNQLTPNRLRLLRAIRRNRSGSIYALAKIVGRDLKNVQNDLRVLDEYGLVQLRRGRSASKRRVKVPRALFGEIALKIAI